MGKIAHLGRISHRKLLKHRLHNVLGRNIISRILLVFLAKKLEQELYPKERYNHRLHKIL